MAFYRCPECAWPVCEEMCAYGGEHADNECHVFSAMKAKVEISDFNVIDKRYWSLAVLRTLLLKEKDPEKFRLVQRMMDHNEDHAKDEDTWNLYK